MSSKRCDHLANWAPRRGSDLIKQKESLWSLPYDNGKHQRRRHLLLPRQINFQELPPPPLPLHTPLHVYSCANRNDEHCRLTWTSTARERGCEISGTVYPPLGGTIYFPIKFSTFDKNSITRFHRMQGMQGINCARCKVKQITQLCKLQNHTIIQYEWKSEMKMPQYRDREVKCQKNSRGFSRNETLAGYWLPQKVQEIKMASQMRIVHCWQYAPDTVPYMPQIMPQTIVAKKWEPGNLVPSRFSGEIRKVEARLGKLAKIRKVGED